MILLNDNPKLKILLVLLLAGISCTNHPELRTSEQPEPVINFIAISDFSDTATEFSQVLLKIELLNTKTDILKYGIHTPDEHQTRLNYYRVFFKNDISLVSSLDTLPCYDVHAERLYMDLPYMNFILTFNHQITSADQLKIDDLFYTNKSVFVNIEPKMSPR